MGRRTRLHVNLSMPDGRVAASRGLDGWLAEIAPGRARGEVTVALVSDRRMRVLNRAFRGKDYATDVLAFATGTPESALGSRTSPAQLGDIVIATGVATRQAREHGHAPGTELKVLSLHGLLHLLGYDHDDPADEGRMNRAEGRLRTKAGLSTGLIARAKPRSAGSPLPIRASRRRS